MSNFEDVKKFMETFGQMVRTKPQFPDEKTMQLRFDLIQEELNELEQAMKTKNLKEIADVCGIKKNLTFHIARHTFATTVTLSNGMPIETVSKLLGHSRISTTQIYAKVIERKVSDDMQKLRAQFNEIENESISKVVSQNS